MGSNRFLYDKIVRSGVLAGLVANDYHPSYPPENLRNLWTAYHYRTKYGTGSGWGLWWIDSTNNKIDFNDGSVRVATLTANAYDASSLAAEIASKMTAAGGQTYTCTYSDSTNKFTISASSTFSLLWSTGANKANSVGTHIGYDMTQDDTGSNSYTADYLRIHNAAGFQVDSFDGSAVQTSGCVLLGLNVTSSYQIFRLDKWVTSVWSTVGSFTYNSTAKVACIFYTPTSATKYRVVIRDWTNANKYIKIGVPVLGEYQELSRGYEYGATIRLDDTSQRQYSKGGYLNISVGYEHVVESVVYELMSADEAKIDTVWSNVMRRYPFVFIRDSANPSTTLKYALLQSAVDKQQLDEYFKRVTMTWETVL